MIMMLNNKKTQFTNSYEDKAVYTQYDADKYNIYSQTRNIILEQLSTILQSGKVEPSVFSGTVVDVGCGTGNALLELSQSYHFSKMYGLEPSSEMLKIAQSKLPDLIGICDSADNLQQHFAEPIADLLNFHFIFAFLDYKQLIQQATHVVKKDGLISICTNSAHSFAYIQELCKKYWGSLTQRIFKTDIEAVRQKYLNFMPQNTNELISELEKNDFEILKYKTIHAQINVKSASEAWRFLYNAGWFTAELKNSSINKYKVYGLFYCIKFLTLLLKHQLIIEEKLEIIVLTAKKK